MSQRGRLLQIFADKFEPDGAAYLYRRTPRSPPIRVTAPERDVFVADFTRDLSRLNWVFVAAVVVVIVGLVTYETAFGGQDQPYFTYVGLFAVVAVYAIPYWHYSNAPWRALRTRGVIGEGRSAGQVREVMLAKLTWRGFGASILIVTLGFLRLALHENLTVGWNRLWLVGAAIFYVAIGYRVYRKFRMTRTT